MRRSGSAASPCSRTCSPSSKRRSTSRGTER
jgi:hypothetical protein